MSADRRRPVENEPAVPVGSPAFADPDAFARLRRYAVALAGPHEAPALLYRLGFDRGWADGAAVAAQFGKDTPLRSQLAGPPLRLLFSPTEGRVPEDFGGELSRSLEAETHVESGYDGSAACHLTAGYAAGWYSSILGQTILVTEDRCSAAGAVSCHFRARPAQHWASDQEVGPLDLARYVEPRSSDSCAPPDESAGGDRGFDHHSAAVHVWGPVMVVPYAGVEDTNAALEAVREDLGEEAVRVVVVDLAGARLDELEACRVMEVIGRLEGEGLDVVISGVRARTSILGTRISRRGHALMVPDLTEGIARAFQIAYTPAGAH